MLNGARRVTACSPYFFHFLIWPAAAAAAERLGRVFGGVWMDVGLVRGLVWGLEGPSEVGEARSEEDSRVRLKAGLGGFVLGGKKGLGPSAVHAGPRLYRETRPGVSQLPIGGVTGVAFR